MAKNVEAARILNVDATRIVCEEAGMYNLLVFFRVTIFVMGLILCTCCLNSAVLVSNVADVLMYT